ncbi:MAG: glycosyltransferase [Nitrospira sp.]
MSRLNLCFIGPAENITTRRWVEWFTDRGHTTTVVTVEPTQHRHRFRQIDLSCSTGGRKMGRIIAAARLGHVIRQVRPDVLHVHYVRGLAWGTPFVRSCPIVASPWGSDVLDEQGAFKEWYSRWLTQQVLASADLVTVHSSYMEHRVRPLLQRGSRMVRIGWGINLQAFKPELDVEGLRARWQLSREQRVIFSPRLAQPCYRQDLIIRAFSLVRKENPHAVLMLSEQFASPEYVRQLRTLVSELGLSPWVMFIGAIPYLDMPLWMNLADVMVMAPESDGMPNSLLEAMACGAFPVLNQLPQYAEIIHDGINGLLACDNPEDMARALLRALSSQRLRSDAASFNREFVKTEADQDQEMARMEAWYEDLRRGTS